MTKEINPPDTCGIGSFDGDLQGYWENVFETKDVQNWHEEKHQETLELLNQSGTGTDRRILCVGAGDSTLVDYLVAKGQQNVIVNDISMAALNKTRQRVGSKPIYLVEDLMEPRLLFAFENQVDVWIDRATLHFFTTCRDKGRYFSLLNQLVKPGGHAIISVFSKNNDPKCCGLDLQLWSEQSLINRLPNFKLKQSHIQIFKEKNGRQREYIHVLFQKTTT
jgi:SAM-dependent methyltransferase